MYEKQLLQEKRLLIEKQRDKKLLLQSNIINNIGNNNTNVSYDNTDTNSLLNNHDLIDKPKINGNISASYNSSINNSPPKRRNSKFLINNKNYNNINRDKRDHVYHGYTKNKS